MNDTTISSRRDPVPDLKRQLARALIDRFGRYNQFVIANNVGIDQPRASELLRGRIRRFSLQQLVRFVCRANGDVQLTVTWRSPQVRMFFFRPRRLP